MFKQGREFLKDTIRLTFDFSKTDQSLGVPAPPLEKPAPPDAERIRLPGKKEWGHYSKTDLLEAISKRRSIRDFKDDPLELDELAYLLWVTQGVQRKFENKATFRPVPSAGARHALETYLIISAVKGLDAGVYRYLPLEHELVAVAKDGQIRAKLAEAVLGQGFAATAAVVFVWTAMAYRMEWRYGPASSKAIALDAGHVCQNLYLACEGIGCGTCAVGAYHQELMDQVLGVDGEDEFVIYLAPVGKV